MEKQELIEAGFTEEQADVALGLHNKDVEGLKSKNDELIGKTKAAAEKARAAAEAEEAARLAAQQAEEQRLLDAGEIEEYKKKYEARLAEQTARAELAEKAAKAERDGIHREKFLSEALSKFDEPYRAVVRDSLEKRLEVRYNDDKAAVGLADGENFIDSGSFADWAKENESYKHMVIGVKSSGGGASNGLANSLRANNPNKRDYLSMSMDEKVAFLENNRG